jgi:hypothetical protein
MLFRRQTGPYMRYAAKPNTSAAAPGRFHPPTRCLTPWRRERSAGGSGSEPSYPRVETVVVGCVEAVRWLSFEPSEDAGHDPHGQDRIGHKPCGRGCDQSEQHSGPHNRCTLCRCANASSRQRLAAYGASPLLTPQLYLLQTVVRDHDYSNREADIQIPVLSGVFD